mgnify:CR=1 FL=1
MHLNALAKSQIILTDIAENYIGKINNQPKKQHRCEGYLIIIVGKVINHEHKRLLHSENYELSACK